MRSTAISKANGKCTNCGLWLNGMNRLYMDGTIQDRCPRCGNIQVTIPDLNVIGHIRKLSNVWQQIGEGLSVISPAVLGLGAFELLTAFEAFKKVLVQLESRNRSWNPYFASKSPKVGSVSLNKLVRVLDEFIVRHPGAGEVAISSGNLAYMGVEGDSLRAAINMGFLSQSNPGWFILHKDVLQTTQHTMNPWSAPDTVEDLMRLPSTPKEEHNSALHKKAASTEALNQELERFANWLREQRSPVPIRAFREAGFSKEVVFEASRRGWLDRDPIDKELATFWPDMFQNVTQESLLRPIAYLGRDPFLPGGATGDNNDTEIRLSFAELLRFIQTINPVIINYCADTGDSAPLMGLGRLVQALRDIAKQERISRSDISESYDHTVSDHDYSQSQGQFKRDSQESLSE